jgi:hypothetical protein
MKPQETKRMYLQSNRVGQLSEDIPLAQQARVEREAFERFVRDCDGVRMLSWLRREGPGPGEDPLQGQQATLLERRLKDMSKIFERKRALEPLEQSLRTGQISMDEFSQRMAVLLHECHDCPTQECGDCRTAFAKKICGRKRQLEQSLRIRQITLGEFFRQMERLLDACLLQEYKFPPDYVLRNEQEETAKARCALSQFKWREWGPSRRPVSDSECETIGGRFRATRERLAAVTRDVQTKQGLIENQRSRLERLQCDRWPSGVRPPPDHPRWCAEIKAKIRQLEQELSQLAESARTLGDQLFSIGRDHAAGCGERRLVG